MPDWHDLAHRSRADLEEAGRRLILDTPVHLGYRDTAVSHARPNAAPDLPARAAAGTLLCMAGPANSAREDTALVVARPTRLPTHRPRRTEGTR